MRIIAPIIVLALAGCAAFRGPPGRTVEDMLKLPAEEARVEVPVGVSVDKLAAVMPALADIYDLDLEGDEKAPGTNWVFERGKTLFEAELWFRVELVASGDGAIIRVWGKPQSYMKGETQETMRRPQEIAARMIALASGAKLGDPELLSTRDAKAAIAASLSAPAARYAVADKSVAVWDGRKLGNGVLLDVRVPEVDGYHFAAGCGPLQLVDPATGKPIWTMNRDLKCEDTIIERGGDLVILRKTEKDRQLLRVVGATGQVVSQVAMPLSATLFDVAGVVFTAEWIKSEQATPYLLTRRDPKTLAVMWTTPGDMRLVPRVVSANDSVIAINHDTGALHDLATGKPIALANAAAPPKTLSAVAGGAVAVVDGQPLQFFTNEGKLAWSAPGVVVATLPQGILSSDGERVVLRAPSGTELWSTRLAATPSGQALLVKKTLVMPTQNGVVFLDAQKGTLKTTAQAFAEDKGGRRTEDELSVAPNGVITIDTLQGVAGFDESGKVLYALPVRSLKFEHRESRMRLSRLPAIANNMAQANALWSLSTSTNQLSSIATGVGMSTATFGLMAIGGSAALAASHGMDMIRSLGVMNASKLGVAQAQTALDRTSSYIVRPISWSRGRGVLVVRKSDGAFAEVVTGAPDVYDDIWVPTSVALVSGNVLLTGSEGINLAEWGPEVDCGAAKVTPRAVRGLAFDETQLKSASQYAQASIVPVGDVD